MREGAKQAILEAKGQGVKIPMPDLDDAVEGIAARAGAIDVLMARSISEAAGRNAVSLTGGSLSSQAVADQVRDYLLGLTDSYLYDQLGGALTQAVNTGRKEVINSGPTSQIYASELLDDATCEECVSVDGTEFEDMAAAEEAYPTGGYAECLGGPRCRGTIVAVYEEAGS